ncbi:MAG: hypothetical protein KGJ09_04935 [Candidatus Omnitrophica bacterium]|nr:hypothetical protein [Candidatus Omnitrophota bacterium]MDE2009408.1 hypothetical protein [Candidatus Omnitrophota bacterium]MDE2214192.1 hypothetical protein [Candidatus Omnitrophota bacterium]MDE2231229.1 hypothetical protein [Candidatus Omnitrophota bacterium]
MAIVMTLSLGFVISLWVFYTLGRSPAAADRDFFRQCRFCGYLYFDYSKKTPGTCPCCGSYQD